ncbi:MAG: MarR family transcriptional regulator [Sphaerochaetaceae bacterium]|nr:MarR family transcriptional regulator [Sphaerochaetaceae bacterium]MDC7250880.1 MarR family transcriptional regulator [Sphaerochaetaceae bacterium]
MNKSASCELRRLTNHVRRKLMTFKGDKNNKRQTSSHYYIINYIASKGNEDVFQRDIDQRFSLRRPTTTEILKLMERNGLVTKKSVENDLRLKKVVLTKKAKVLGAEFETFLDDMESQMTEGISEEHMEIFFDVVEKMRLNLENES